MPLHSVPSRVVPRFPAGAVGGVVSFGRALAFWLAVTLPLAYISIVLVAPQLLADPTLLVGTLGGNFLALLLGHNHTPSAGPRRSKP